MQVKAQEMWNKFGVGSKLAIAVVAVTLYKVVQLFNQLDEATENFLQTLGTTRDVADKLLDISFNTYSELAKYGVSLDKSLDVTMALVEEYGRLDGFSDRLQKSTTIMAQAFGMTAGEAATLVKLQKESLGLSDEQVENNMKLIKANAKIYNIGAGRIAKDLAGSAEDVAKFSGAGMDSIIKSAAYARRLGSSFSEIATIAESLLDIGTSTASALQVQMLTGKAINISEARSLALKGEVGQANEAILKQLGTHAEMQDADYFTKKAISDLLGVQENK